MANASATPQQLNLFSCTDIGHDGVLLLNMIGYISSDILVRDIILNLWYFKHVKLEAGQTLSQQRTNYNIAVKIYVHISCTKKKKKEKNESIFSKGVFNIKEAWYSPT
jgi:hypothetical protein